MKYNFRKLNLAIAIAVLTVFCFNLDTYAQKIKPDQVPQEVKTTFYSEFPNAKIKDWQMKGDNFQVNYRDDGTSQSTLISKTGSLIETRTPIDKQEIPGFIADYVGVEYVGYEILLSELVQKPKMKDTYEVKVKKSGVGTGAESQLVFANDGKLLSRNDPQGFVASTPPVDKVAEKKENPKETNNNSKTKEKAAKNPNSKEDNKEKNKSKKGQYPDNIISENSVPPIVKKNFVKKFPKATEVKWFNRKGDTIYTIKCIFKEQENEIAFNSDGKWLTQKIKQDEKTIFPAVAKYLDKTYRKYQFVSSYKTVSFNKNEGGFDVKIIELKNKKSKLETTILFDKMGKLVKTIDPEYEYEQDVQKETSADRKLEEEYNKSATNLEDDNTNGIKVVEKELPSPLTSYISANYPGMKIKSSFLRDIDELGSCYEVSVAREGIGQETIVLIFDKYGKFIKNANMQDDETNENANLKNTQKEFLPADTVLSAFKIKHPKANKVTWEPGENNDFIASYTDGTGPHKSYFSSEGVWIKTSTTTSLRWFQA